MEAVAKQITSYSAKEMNIKQKKTIALQVIPFKKRAWFRNGCFWVTTDDWNSTN